MKPGSKIGFLLIVHFFLLFTLSCSRNKNDVIPDVYINFTVDLLDPEFVNLNAMFGSVTVSSRTNNWGYSAAGYDNNGIIVFCGPDEYYAYDRTCPHDFAVNNLSIKVNLDPDFLTNASCPECGTVYELSASGTPISGPGRYPLKNYKTSFYYGRYITVWND